MSRIFVALSPDSKLKAEINRASVAWRDQLNFAKWVHQDDLHLTLKFSEKLISRSSPRSSASLPRSPPHSVPSP